MEIEFDGDLIVTFGLLSSKSPEYRVSYPEAFEIIDPRLKEEIEKAVISEGLKAVESNQ